MDGRDRHIEEEAAELWLALFGTPAPEGATGRALLSAAISRLETPNYQRLHKPALSDPELLWPGAPGESARAMRP